MGSKEDGSRSLTILREAAPSGPDSSRSPVLGGLSETELDAIVSMLRTDKNLAVAPAPTTTGCWGALTEQMLLSSAGALDPRVSEAARDEAARHAWHIALGEQVKGPLDIAALRTYWERGELGPDSLCWRKGFEDWRPVCRVLGLAELLAPRATVDPSSPEDLVPNRRADVPDFPLKGAEALRILAEEVPPPLPRQAPLPPPVLEPEPVTAPALDAEPDTVPDAPQAQAADEAQALLSTPPPTQVEVRVRGGVWLALSGGLVGGMLVTCVVWLLGLSAGLGASSRGATPELTLPTRSAEPPARASAPTLAAPVAAKPDTAVPVPTIGTTAVPVPTIGTLGSTVATTALSTREPTPLARSIPTGSESTEAPKRLSPPSRPALPDPTMRKVVKPAPTVEANTSTQERVASRAAQAKEEVDDDLKLDEEFARELEGTGKPPAQPKRTVWIPPDPTPKEPPASLTESDIFSVVVANKSDITSCVNEQKPQSNEGTHRVVVRWSILPSGRVTDVVTETARFRGTPLALCLEGKIQSWTFPQHHEQGGPVRFPFVF